ncbi:putative sulfate exporter family transporter [Ideonella sp. 4Y16]|uniref:Sulfate exporter family transporter n=1 Tax=Ideonella alba TaxID=2824118 RepID=A0A940Y5Y7_9BURK|nr:putative sulfate exporter family transporter [Ideonella alba]MBQ0929316.1 putative sulfate exporter family transporter [Ideonella alba]MBQ0945426.1 putative sulfate exporter family transporter [Ideonella alba]
MLNALARAASPAQLRALFPGAMACAVVAAAAGFLGQHYGAPVLLFALLLGLAMNFLAAEGPCGPGIAFCSRGLLRAGVALLGLRITAGQVLALGWGPLAMVLLCVALTIGLSMLAARAMGFQGLFGLLTGGATAICGASAALALSAALPAHPQKERATLFTVIGVSALSTLVMVAYPMLVRSLGLDARHAGIFLGATIHDVAQVVGAGYSVSSQAGDVATLVKLLRVAMLLPVIMLASAVTRVRLAAAEPGAQAGPRPPLLPGFALAFALIVAVNSTGFVPTSIQSLGSECSRWFLVAAIAGIGMKTELKQLATVGLRPVILMVGETAFLAALTLGLMRWMT